MTTSFSITRRQFLKRVAAGTAAAGLAGPGPLFADGTDKSRRAWVLSDAHVGHTDDGRDGAQWLTSALADARENLAPIDYGLALGDMVHNGTRDEFRTYRSVRDPGGIPKWFDLAGNHEYGKQGLSQYEARVRSSRPYYVIDGNLAWFFLSDETPRAMGKFSLETLAWLKKHLTGLADKIIIVCSHQLVYDTVRASRSFLRYIRPRDELQALLDTCRVDLWLCGHQHKFPYSTGEIAVRGRTTFINVASVSHAYGTGQSQSTLLEFRQGEKRIIARRRDHDNKAFINEFKTEIPTPYAISLQGQPATAAAG